MLAVELKYHSPANCVAAIRISPMINDMSPRRLAFNGKHSEIVWDSCVHYYRLHASRQYESCRRRLDFDHLLRAWLCLRQSEYYLRLRSYRKDRPWVRE